MKQRDNGRSSAKMHEAIKERSSDKGKGGRWARFYTLVRENERGSEKGAGGGTTTGHFGWNRRRQRQATKLTEQPKPRGVGSILYRAIDPK